MLAYCNIELMSTCMFIWILLPVVMIFVSCMCRELAKDFVVAGTASESLYGACEAMFKPDMVCFSTQCAYLFNWQSRLVIWSAYVLLVDEF